MIILKVISESKYKEKTGTGIKILTLKQMLQRLPIALAQGKAVIIENVC